MIMLTQSVNAMENGRVSLFKTERVCTNLHGTLCSLTFIHIQLSVTFTKVHLLPKANQRCGGCGCKAWTLAKFTSRPSWVFLQCFLAFMPHMISRASTVSARRECKHASSFKKKKKKRKAPRKFKSSSEALERSRITVKQCLHKVFQETIIKPLWCVSC